MEYKRLNKVCNLYYGKNLPGKDFLEEGFPVFGANGVIGSYSEYTHENPMLLVSCRGENSGVINISPPKAFITNNSIVCEIIDDEVDQAFLFYFLKAQQRERLLSGSAQPQITTFDLGRFKLYNLPPKSEQTAIAAILTKVDDAIAATESSIRAAEKLKQALMQNLLTGKLRPDGSWRTEEEFFVDEKFGRVPLGWEIKTVGKLFDMNQSTLSSKTEPDFRFRYITIEAVSTETINYDSCPEYTFSEAPGRARRVINSGDILISGVRPNLKSFAIYQKPNDENWICSTGFFVLTPKEEQNGLFHFYQILGHLGERQFHSYVAGTNYPAIGDREMKDMKLFCPPYEEQKLISAKLASLSGFNEHKQAKVLTLQRLKKSLMQNLLTGKVRVAADQLTSLLAEPA